MSLNPCTSSSFPLSFTIFPPLFVSCRYRPCPGLSAGPGPDTLAPAARAAKGRAEKLEVGGKGAEREIRGAEYSRLEERWRSGTPRKGEKLWRNEGERRWREMSVGEMSI